MPSMLPMLSSHVPVFLLILESVFYQKNKTQTRNFQKSVRNEPVCGFPPQSVQSAQSVDLCFATTASFQLLLHFPENMASAAGLLSPGLVSLVRRAQQVRLEMDQNSIKGKNFFYFFERSVAS